MEKTRVAVVGGGITGLAVAAWLDHEQGINDLVVLEAGVRSGGKVFSEVRDGHILEWGPQGFLDNAPDTLELVRLSGLEGAVVKADEVSAERFILRQGRLRSVPLSPGAFLTSDVLPLVGRLRVLLEPFARRRPDTDESVFAFARRRIGPRAAEILVDAMVTGVFAGDSRQLSLAATFPRMAAMEARHGSLTRALLAAKAEARAAGRRSGGPAGPGGTLSTFDRGMSMLPDRLADHLDGRLRLGTSVQSVERMGDQYRLRGEDLELECDALLLAVPAPAAARLLANLAPGAVAPLDAIPAVPIAVVMSSYRDPMAFGAPVTGFGFLVPRSENLGILGTLFCHAIFPGQAPDGRLFLRTMIGGARDPEATNLDDAALLLRVRGAHKAVLGHDPQPDDTWIVRHPEGISQYTLGHLDRVRAAEEAAATVGVILVGSPFHGVSVNDCIRQARDAARRVAAKLQATRFQSPPMPR